ncbi:MAG: histidinol-phosphate transaminase [Nitrospirales bacterium]|nr:histidinol-phosphate transaminase [Nitrospirales bacterium]
MIRPLPYVGDIRPYVPGKPVKELERDLGIQGSIKLASNENPLGPSPLAVDALRKALSEPDDLSRYPDGGGFYLKNALSSRLCSMGSRVRPEEIILGNGSNELLDIAVRTFMGSGDEAVMAAPSFVVYSMATRSVGGTAVEVPLREYRHDLMAMADAITDRTRMVFIANPNNPTGTANTGEEFSRFMARVPEGVLVVVDEAYVEYVSAPDHPDSLRYLAEGRDILVLRTFSKAYGLAGLRIGYGIAKAEILAEMNKLRNPFNTGTLAQWAALHALGDDAHLERTRGVNDEGKAFLYRELEALGLRYVPTETNFIYMPLDREAGPLYEALLQRGVIIRPMGQREIRVTIGLPDENRRFVEALKEVLGL